MWAFGTSQPGTVTGQDDFTFLGKDVVFKGVLTLEGNIRVDGRLEGELRSTGTLIVGEHAVIRGNIMAGILITSGRINGDVIASERIKILKPGVVVGDIRTPAISIEQERFSTAYPIWRPISGSKTGARHTKPFLTSRFTARACSLMATNPSYTILRRLFRKSVQQGRSE